MRKPRRSPRIERSRRPSSADFIIIIGRERAIDPARCQRRMVAGCTTRGGSPDTCRWIAPIVSSAVDPQRSLRLLSKLTMPTAQREFGFGTISKAYALLSVDAGPSARMATAGEMANRSFLNDPKHWRDRAEEARTRADQLDDPQSKSAMLRIAHDYELLAERAEARASGHSPKSN